MIDSSPPAQLTSYEKGPWNEGGDPIKCVAGDISGADVNRHNQIERCNESGQKYRLTTSVSSVFGSLYAHVCLVGG